MKQVRWGVKFTERQYGSEMGHPYSNVVDKTIVFSTKQAAEEFASQFETAAETGAAVTSPTVFKVE